MDTQTARPPPTRDSMLRRYKWKDLTEPEREAVWDSVGVAATRAGVGAGAVITVSAAILNARRGKPPLPGYLKYGMVGFFTCVGAYMGFLSGGPVYARRILSVPDSQLAEDLRIVVGDWQSRVPETQISQIQPLSEETGNVNKS